MSRTGPRTSGGASYFDNAVRLLDRIRDFLDDELVLFREELVSVGNRTLVSVRLSDSARKLDEMLEDIVMLHVDEPDGSFARSLAQLISTFEAVVQLMRDSLSSWSEGLGEIIDTEHLQMLSREAA